MLTCYRTDAVERRDGGIEGVGLFATRQLHADQFLALKGGRLINEDVLTDNLNTINGSHHQVAPSLFLTGLTPEEVDTTLIGYNHSCDPNAYIDGQIAVRTLRSVAEGEEITVDYATIFSTDTQSFKCRCGSTQCRHNIVPSLDSQNPAIRKKYRGHLADFLEHPGSYKNVNLLPIDSSCPTTSYITSKVQRVEAEIHGFGLEVIEPIHKDELLAMRGGTIVTADEVIKRQDELLGTEVQLTDYVFLAGFTEQERLATMMGFNHSCSPNSFVRGQIGVYAMQDIEVGSELTVEYATAYVSPSQRFDCSCGSRTCRGFVDTTIDWKNPEIRTRFNGHFADFIQRKIAQQRNHSKI